MILVYSLLRRLLSFDQISRDPFAQQIRVDAVGPRHPGDRYAWLQAGLDQREFALLVEFATAIPETSLVPQLG